MVRKSIRVSVDRSQGAKLASGHDYFNATGVLIIHAAIAYADALTIRYIGAKSKGEDHHEVITLLEEIFPLNDERKKSLNHLTAIIEHKNAVSHSGDIYGKKDIEQLWKHFERFKAWAIPLFK